MATIERVAIQQVRTGWGVLAREKAGEALQLVQVVKIGGEQSARAWARWWDQTIEVHGLEAARDLLPHEIKRCQAAVAAPAVPSTERPDLEHDPATCTCNNGPAMCVDCRAFYDARAKVGR